MADYSSTTHVQAIGGNSSSMHLQTATAITEDSYLEYPHKPPQQTAQAESKKLLPRKKSEQALYKIHNNNTTNSKISSQQVPSQAQSLQLSGECSTHHPMMHEQSSIVVQIVEDDSKLQSMRGGPQQYYQGAQSVPSASIRIDPKRNAGSTNAACGGMTSTRIESKRTSINSYHKRVVELNLHQNISMKSLHHHAATDHSQKNLTNQPQSTKNQQNVKQLTLDVSDMQLMTPTSTNVTLSSRVNDIKRALNRINSGNGGGVDSTILSQQQQQNEFSGDKSLTERARQPKVTALSTNVSPKATAYISSVHSTHVGTVYASPRLSIGSGKSKLMIRKQGGVSNNNNISKNINYPSGGCSLNKSDQYVFTTTNNTVVNQTLSHHYHQLHSHQENIKTLQLQQQSQQQVPQQCYSVKQNSPEMATNRILQPSRTNQNSSVKKQPINTSYQSSASTFQLLRNLSSEKPPLRICTSSKDLLVGLRGQQQQQNTTVTTQVATESNGSQTQRATTNRSKERIALENGRRDSAKQRYYSPTAMSLNKALTRISSVTELKKAREQISQSRKSIQNTTSNNAASSKKSLIAGAPPSSSGLSTILTAQMVMKSQRKTMNQQSKKQSYQLLPHTGGAASCKAKEYTSQQQPRKVESPRSCEGSDSDTDDYMTNQEKLWAAIEMKQGVQVVEEIMKREEVQVNAKNIFDDGWTALHYAVHEGCVEVVKLLIEKYSAQIDLRSSTNKTPFHLACIRGDETLIKYLLEKGASACAVDRDGCTPLHYLCESENHEMIKLILPSSQAAKDVRNRFGLKPVDLIKDKQFRRTLRYLSSKRDSSSHSTTSKSKSKTRINSQRGSRSRERSNHRQPNIVQIHKVSEDRIQECIQEMFRKFSLYNRCQYAQPSTTGRPRSKNKIQTTSQEQSVDQSRQQQTARAMNSPQLTALGSSKKAQQYAKRFTTNEVQKQQQQQPQQPKFPLSCKNAHKPQPKQMFAAASTNITQNILNKNISPNKINFNRKPFDTKKPSHDHTAALATSVNNSLSTKLAISASQRDLLPRKSQPQHPAAAKLNTARSYANLLEKDKQQPTFQQQQQVVTAQPLEIKIDEDVDEDYNIVKRVQQPQLKQQKRSQEEAQNVLSSQRTGESSQIYNNNNNNQNQSDQSQSILRNLKFTLSLSDEQLPGDQEPKIEQEKIGPSSFIAHQLLGTGSFGEVYLVEKISTGKYYAMKVLSKSKIMGHNLTRYAMTERNVLSIANHPFIVKLNYAFQTQEKLFLILDYCPGGDLAEYLQLEKRFNEDKTRLYASEILLAIEELHRKDIIFRDLKPDNVVLDMEGHAMLTDFGLSKEGVLDNGMAKSFCGSYAYLAPEMLRKIGHGKAVDWYLLGVVIYEMLCGIPPYYANNKEELFENIKHATLEIPPYVSPVAKDIIVKLLNRNPKKRMGAIGGADEIKKHPFFKSIDWNKLYRRQYKPPEPYLKKRFENFLSLSPAYQTNAEVYEALRKQAALVSGQQEETHIPGWSFISPRKEHDK